jgi:predicted SnoaL-like aldol condensation-catalyzing enzyme
MNKSLSIFAFLLLAAFTFSCNTSIKTASTSPEKESMELTNKQKAVALIESIETGAQEPAGYVNPEKYTQHNLAVADGLAGFGEVMAHAPAGGFKSEVVRSFQDNDYVFIHTKYDFFGPKAAFDIFRFEDGKIVEHWDNLTAITPVNPSGRTQFDGTTEITDLDKTEANKAVVKAFIKDVLMDGKSETITDYINPEKYLQHNSGIADGLDGLGAALKYFAENDLQLKYDKVHMVLGEGNFVLTASEGLFGPGDHVGYYDLFRLEAGKIVEHWDVIEKIPAKEEWKNSNGKF